MSVAILPTANIGAFSSTPTRSRRGTRSDHAKISDVVIDIVLVVFFGSVLVAFYIWSIADAARFPEAAFQSIGASRTKWLIYIAVAPGLGSGSFRGTVRARLLRWQDEQLGIEREIRRHVVPSPMLAVIGFASLFGVFFLGLGLWWDGKPIAAVTVAAGSAAASALSVREINKRVRNGELPKR